MVTMTNDLTNDIAQMIWEVYAADYGRALPTGFAERAAQRIVNELGLTDG